MLDWELAHLGDPLEDLGWLCVRAWRFGGDGPVGGFGTREDLYAAYEAAGGQPVDPEVARWWEVLGTLKWGVMCIVQAATHLTGQSRSVELAAIGRRVCEQEYDLLALIDPAGAVPPPTVGAAASSFHDAPSAAELLEAVKEWVEGDAREATTGRVQFHTRVVANVMAMLERELESGPAMADAHAARLATLGVTSERDLADRIRAGEWPVDDREVVGRRAGHRRRQARRRQPQVPLTSGLRAGAPTPRQGWGAWCRTAGRRGQTRSVSPPQVVASAGFAASLEAMGHGIRDRIASNGPRIGEAEPAISSDGLGSVTERGHRRCRATAGTPPTTASLTPRPIPCHRFAQPVTRWARGGPATSGLQGSQRGQRWMRSRRAVASEVGAGDVEDVGGGLLEEDVGLVVEAPGANRATRAWSRPMSTPSNGNRSISASDRAGVVADPGLGLDARVGRGEVALDVAGPDGEAEPGHQAAGLLLEPGAREPGIVG